MAMAWHMMFRSAWSRIVYFLVHPHTWRLTDIAAPVSVVAFVYVFVQIMLQLSPQSLHTNPLTSSLHRNDKSYFISGRKFMDSYTPDEVEAKFGYRVVHQTWKDMLVRDEQYDAFISWEKLLDPHSFLHILWTDDDNLALIKNHYPQYLTRYEQLVLPVQKTDFVRLLYLHRYGGIYADLDIRPHTDVFAHLEQHYSKIDASGKKRIHDVLIVESPILLNEVLQNAFMVASVRNHEFYLSAAEGIHEIITFINDESLCLTWNGCQYVALFHNKFLYRFVNMLMTLYMTGPSVLDKIFVRHTLGGKGVKWDVVKLPKEEYYLGSIVSHTQDNTWVKPAQMVPELTELLVIFLLFLCGLVIAVWYQHRTIRKMRNSMVRNKPVSTA